ncbi:MAG: hypothetical protein OER80_14725 [Gammaproteobacteria bacterium]|nr:hypothetical protein [Gammaproteobacteria bacterium]MDH3768069.1 hypothetical protein [Gammaproteobacteria bacterium]
MRRWARTLLMIAAYLLTVSCISHVRQPYDASTGAVSAAPAGPFVAARTAVEMQREPALRPNRRNYTVERFRFAATGNNGQPDGTVSGRLFSGRTVGRRPVVIVLPVWGISEYPSKKFTRDLLKRSGGEIDVMLVESEAYLIDWDALTNAATETQFRALAHDTGDRLRDMVMDVRRMVDWLGTQERIDPQRIGVIGFSLSAVVASLTLQHEPRLAAGVVVLGGSNPAEIFAVCTGRPGQVRKAAMQRFGFSPETYLQIFQEGLAGGDSRAYPGRIPDPSRLLFIEATHDHCMTQESRDGLWQALGKPQRISFNFDHRPAFYAMTPLGFNIMGRYTTRFFEQTLTPKP